MKRIFFVALTSIVGVSLHAQQARVVSAYNYLNSYKNEKNPDDLRNAKKNIDEATLNESTSQKPKTWYYRGNVYLEIYNSDIKAEVPDALQQTADAYLKVYELDPKYEFAEESWQKSLFAYKNLGILAFNANEFDRALSLFEKVVDMTTKKGATDKEAIENSAIAAMRGKNYDKAITYLRQIVTMNMDTSGGQYGLLYSAYLGKNDSLQAYVSLKEGRSKFPKYLPLLMEDINYNLFRKNFPEVEKLLKEAIALDPQNDRLYFAAGTTYEVLQKRKEAFDAYQKTIELNPKAWDAYYNMGANYNNEGRRLQELANNEKDMKKYDAGIKLADEELKKALVNLEKAKEYVPVGKDRDDVLNALKQLYVRLNMTDKYNEVKKELENK